MCETHPVHDEDFTDIEPLLQELGGYRNRVEVTEPPEVQTEREKTLNTIMTLKVFLKLRTTHLCLPFRSQVEALKCS